MADLNKNNDYETKATYSAEDIEKNKWYAFAAYWGILVLIPIFGAKDSPYAKFHANQGLVLLIANVAISILSNVLAFIPFLGATISIVLSIASIAIAVFAIIGMVNAAQGKAKALPIIENIKILK